MREEKISFISRGKKLIGIKTIPERTSANAIILFHGLTNTRDDCPLILDTAKELTKRGFITLRFDYFGSGESPGNLSEKTMSSLEADSKAAIKYLLKDERVKNIGLWGRSMGGTMVLMIPENKRITCRVCVSPGVLFEKEFAAKMVKLQEEAKRLATIGQKVPGTGKFKGKYELDKGWYESLKGIDTRISKNITKHKTVLVLGATPDPKVQLSHICTAINKLQEPKKLWIFENSAHDYRGVEKEAIALAVDWFVQWM